MFPEPEAFPRALAAAANTTDLRARRNPVEIAIRKRLGFRRSSIRACESGDV
jgi:hypothetical protein